MSTKFDKMIEIITAMKEGKEIQCRFANSMDKWTMTEEKNPNFQEYDYRIFQAMPKFRIALMFDKRRDYYYTFKVDKEEDEEDLQTISEFVKWVTPWIICQINEGKKPKDDDPDFVMFGI